MTTYEDLRKNLVSHLQKSGYIQTEKVRNAMLIVPREMFVPLGIRSRAYEDNPLPTYSNQTISAPHMNAMMCELLDLHPGERVLEIGTGSGYHAALLGVLVFQKDKNGHVYTIETIRKLAEFAIDNLKNAKLDENVTVIIGDGTEGYKEAAPYDKILVTAAGPRIPEPLIEQLADGGKLCIPVGEQRWSQKLLLISKNGDTVEEQEVSNVVFVPLVGKYGFESPTDD